MRTFNFAVEFRFGTHTDKPKTGREISPKLTAWIVFLVCGGGLVAMKMAGVI